MSDPDRNPHLPPEHWHVGNGGTDWLPQLSPHYKRERVMTPPNYRRWRRILVWSSIVIIFMVSYIWLEELIGVAAPVDQTIRDHITVMFRD